MAVTSAALKQRKEKTMQKLTIIQNRTYTANRYLCRVLSL